MIPLFLKLKEKKRGWRGGRKRKGGEERGIGKRSYEKRKQQSLQLGNAGQQINIAQTAINSGCDLLQPRQ